jgi:hypothetical protein
MNRHQRDRDPENRPTPVPYASSRHPSFEQLMTEQGTAPITDVSLLHGNFWPQEESIEEFLATLDEWRGRKQTDSAA